MTVLTPPNKDFYTVVKWFYYTILFNLIENCSFYWLSSINLIVDKFMLKFKGRTTQKIIIFNKSILTEFKIFALEDFNYTYNWECIKFDFVEKILAEKKQIFVNILNSFLFSFLNSTQSIIIWLIKCLSIYI